MKYEYTTPSDYADPDNGHHFLAEGIRPHLFFTKKRGVGTKNYLLHVIDPTLPLYRFRKILKDYVEFVVFGEWEEETEDDEPPTVLIACPAAADLIYAKRRTRKLLEDKGLEDDKSIKIRFATVEKMKSLGVTAQIWEEV